MNDAVGDVARVCGGVGNRAASLYVLVSVLAQMFVFVLGLLVMLVVLVVLVLVLMLLCLCCWLCCWLLLVFLCCR